MYCINAQSLSLSEYINSALKNNVELKKQELLIRKTQTALSESKRLPNPLLAYEREDLRSGNVRAGEWALTASIPLNFIWQRWNEITVKQKAVEAQKEILDLHIKETVFAIKEMIASVYFKKIKLNLSDSVLISLEKIGNSAQLKSKEGDISGYELQRILTEVNKLSYEIKKTRLSIDQELNRLKLLTNLDTSQIPEPELFNADSELLLENLLVTSFSSRNDLKAINLLIESEIDNLANNKLKSIPSFSLTGGFKKDFAGLKGSVLAIEMELPVFNRNQQQIEVNEIDIDNLLLEKELLTKKIRNEVEDSFRIYKVNKEQNEQNKSLDAISVFNSCRLAYEQGVINVTEFVDGLRAYLDSIDLKCETEFNLMVSLFNIDRVTASEIFSLMGK